MTIASIARVSALLCLCAAATYAADSIPSQQLKIGQSIIDVEFAPGSVDLPASAVLEWVSNAANAVAGYYGSFPVPRARLKVKIAEGRNGVFNGTTWGLEDGALTRISIGQHTTQEILNADWMLTHEFIHMAFPSVPDRNHWIEEGIATYVEPVARVQAGRLPTETIWREMVESMPQGQPESSDRGLDNTHTWGRTYWGGAIFCLVADVQIRERTHNRFGLQDAFRAILKAGGNIEANWPIERALKTGDAATGVTVLSELYEQMRATPTHTDLPALWKRLGVEVSGKKATFDNGAPLAAVRRAITTAR